MPSGSAENPPVAQARPVRALALSFLAVGVLVLATATAYGLHAWRAVKAEQFHQLGLLVDMAARSCDLVLRRQSERLAGIAADIEAAGGPGREEAVRAVLVRHRRMDAETPPVAVRRPGGRLVAASPELPPAVVDALPAISGPSPAAVALRAAPVPGSAGWMMPMVLQRGTRTAEAFEVIALMPLDDGQPLWQGINLPAGSVLGLLRDNGWIQSRLPASSDLTAVFGARHGGYLTEKLEREGFPVSGTAEGESGVTRTWRLLAFRRLATQPVTAYLTVPRSHAWTAWVDRVQVPFLLFVTLLAGLAAAATLGIRLQRRSELARDAVERALLEREAALVRQTALLDQTQHAAKVGGWEYDVLPDRLYWTDATYRLYETSAADFQPTRAEALELIAPESREAFVAAAAKCSEAGEPWDMELEVVTHRGRRLWVRSTGVAHRGESGRVVRITGSTQDVTERRTAEQHMLHMAHYDELTGLANRSLFTAHLSHAVTRSERYGRRLAVLFIDLDRFKVINDTLGHDVGDAVLRAISRRLRDSVRASDLVARLGGDEFVIVVEELESAESMAELSRKLLRAIEKPVQHAGREFILTASIGVATYPADGLDIQALLKHADIAMYRAKEQGKNTFEFFSARPSDPGPDLLSLEARLRKAVMELRQFALHFQPKVAVADGAITGVEALLRWKTPDGMIPPNDFIPLAEETGLIGTIGSWVLGSACAQASAWRSLGLPPLRVAVNLSARQFYGAHLHDEIREVIETTGIDPDCLELEITESVMMKNVEHVARLLRSLKQMRAHHRGRLRHRILLSRLSQAPAHRQPEDRPLAREGHHRGSRRRHHHPRRDRAGAQPAAEGGGRGRGDSGAARLPARARQRRDTGLPVQPARRRPGDRGAGAARREARPGGLRTAQRLSARGTVFSRDCAPQPRRSWHLA
jgi:diguanylate cyclase (GGDEF)-like protein